jgi:BRCT domain type II-containing protein
MADEKVTRILLSRGIAKEVIEGLSNSEAWNLVYSTEPPKAEKERKIEICFTGFIDADKDKLTDIAEQSGFRVVKKRVSKQLDFLCIGENPGPKKLADARQQGAKIISRAEFENLVSTGEIPNER